MTNDNNYIVIQGWMINQLKLKGNELMVYALIYGFSQEQDNWFTGSLGYLANWCQTSKQTIITVLKSLMAKGLINKRSLEKNKVIFNEYKTIIANQVIANPVPISTQSNNLTPCQNSLGGYSNNLMGGSQNSLRGVVKKFDPIILNNNLVDNLEYNIKEINKEKTSAVTKFQPPTLEEVQTYCQQRQNNINPEQFLNFYTAKGWMMGKNKMKDWQAAIRTWEQHNNHATHNLNHNPYANDEWEVL